MRLPKGSPYFRLTRGLQLDLEIALSGVPAKIQPLGLSRSGRRCVETSGDVIKSAFTASASICRALSYLYRRTTPNIIGMLFLSASNKQALELKRRLRFVTVEIDLEEQMRLTPTELTFVSKVRSVLLGDVLTRRDMAEDYIRIYQQLLSRSSTQAAA